MIQDSKRFQIIKSLKLIACLTTLFFIGCKSSNSGISNQEIKQIPNIVLIIGDDQGYPYFGFMGADYVHTPNMDKLAASGTLFTNAYVPANHCRPSLQSLLTAMLPVEYDKKEEDDLQEEMARIRFASEEDRQKYASDFKHQSMQGFETFPGILKSENYKSFQGGKWWEYHYENGSFTHGMTTGWTEEERKNGGKWFKQFMGGDGLDLGRKTMEPVYDFIEENKADPLFVWFAPELPHYPFDAPDQYYQRYSGKDMTESAKRYYANCTWFDDCVGSLIDYMKEQGEHENTLYVYVNDNGWEQNPDQEFRHDSLRWHNGGDKGKLSIYDQSFRTPVIFSWKNEIDTRIDESTLVHSTDIPTTILDYLGLKYADKKHGKSLKPIIESHEGETRDYIIGKVDKLRSESDYMGMDVEAYWVRSDHWFFSRNITLGEEALYDLSEDPNCDHNVASDYPAMVLDCNSKIEAWIKEHTD